MQLEESQSFVKRHSTALQSNLSMSQYGCLSFVLNSKRPEAHRQSGYHRTERELEVTGTALLIFMLPKLLEDRQVLDAAHPAIDAPAG